MSDEETEARMLETAMAMVNQAGLSVSLDHISYEDVIRDARVSRSTVYRRWPYKDLFFSDLLKELAKAATPAAIAGEETAIPGLRQFVLEHVDWLATPELRQCLLLELIRLGSLHDFESMYGSTEWRTYLALHSTFLSVADDELRSDLQSALARSEESFIRRIAAAWQRLSSLMGYRIRAEIHVTIETIASLASADLRGHVLMALASPELATRRIVACPFGALEPAEWSLPALAVAGIAMACFEPDPSIVWDDERLTAVRHALETLEADAVDGA